jgi:flagellar basal body-associated protein FliL
MTKPPKRKRSKLTLALLAPVLMIIFIVGWSLSWIGQSRSPKAKQQPKPIHKTPAKQEEFELVVISNQEEQIQAR